MKDRDQDNSFIMEALPAFISEAHEHLEMIEQLLLRLETTPDDRELLDALFRSAHTIKGSAGIFGLDRVVAFTHHVETLLDQLRDQRKALTPALSTLLLMCNDQIRMLVDLAQDPQAEEATALAHREALVELLRNATAPDRDDSHHATDDASAATTATSAHHWTMAVRFGVDTFRNGMDPLTILNYLRGKGEIIELRCDSDAVPALESLDPENCHLALDFRFDTSIDRAGIEAAFSFVREDCILQLAEPGDRPRDAAAIIESTPEHLRLGDILVGSGAITSKQLAVGLRAQAEAANTDGVAPLLGEVLQAKLGLQPQVVSAALQMQEKQRNAVAKGSEDNRFIRVQADRLDLVINLLGELVIASAGAALLARDSRQRPLIEANHEISRLVEDIRNGTLQLRMVPIGETFARFRRVVRDTAAELGKDVQLDIVGGDTELDKAMVERIADPLMHLVRNAMDHGLETPAQRLAAGKPAQGKLTLSACHESGTILIRIVDDGQGIHLDRILSRAWERGLVERDVVPPDAEILQLIFAPGFSTAETVTNLSGRGVGMDVVRQNIEALRGTVDIFSEPGQGTRIEIRLPLTLAIIDGFLIAVGESKFIFPLNTVVEVLENRTTATTFDARGRCTMELRGGLLPVVNLRQLYALESPQGERCSVIVIQSGTHRCGVMVDQLLGQHQTVIKPLGRMLRSMRGISGSSILGNGEVALIFDVISLCQLAEQIPQGPRTAAVTSTSLQPVSVTSGHSL